jgi:hypothetical protein
MSTSARTRGFVLAAQQPVLERARAPRRSRGGARERSESEFWRSFVVEILWAYPGGAAQGAHIGKRCSWYRRSSSPRA